MAGPSNLGTLLIQRLDALLGHPLSLRGEVAQRSGHRTVTAANQSLHLGGLATSTEHLPEESAEDVRTTQQHQARLQRTAGARVAQAAHSPASNAPRHTTGFSGDATAQFSPAARLILALLEKYPESPALLRPALLTQAGQGMPPASQGALAALFAHALQETIHNSGLFYEAHLARWFLQPGRQPPPDAEPQAQWASARASPEHPPNASTAASQTASLHHPQADTLVRQQLDILAHQSLVWQGQAWPQAPMRWQIQKHDADPQAPEAEPAWTTTLDLELPQLGPVHAHIRLHRKKLHVQLRAPDSADLLQTHAARLHGALTELGLAVEPFDIHAQGDPHAPEGTGDPT